MTPSGSVVVCGGGMIGLALSMMLAHDGHRVTVLEADPAGAPTEPVQAWESWERRGIPQFRQPHTLLARFRRICDEELPGLTDRLLAAGCVRVDPLDALPRTLADRTGRPGDDAYVQITGRRPVIESAVAATAEDQPGVTVRRGVRVAGLLTGSAAVGGVAHVGGVRTTTGEKIVADLVVDATGRRTPSRGWLRDLGARAPQEASVDRGFVYYTRYFAGPVQPRRRGAALCPVGSFSVLTLPGDNDTWSVTVFGLSGDAALKSLRDPDCFTRVVAACPGQVHWLDGRPTTGVLPMAGVLDRHRRFVVEGRPVVTGFAAVGDAWASTNPSVGRGLSVGLLHAQQLRDVARTHLDDPAGFASAWDERTERVVAPYFWDQVGADRARVSEMTASRDGGERPAPDPTTGRFLAAARHDPVVFRGLLETVLCLALPGDVLARPEIRTVVEREPLTAPGPPPGPDRSRLLALLAG